MKNKVKVTFLPHTNVSRFPTVMQKIKKAV